MFTRGIILKVKKIFSFVTTLVFL